MEKNKSKIIFIDIFFIVLFCITSIILSEGILYEIRFWNINPDDNDRYIYSTAALTMSSRNISDLPHYKNFKYFTCRYLTSFRL